MTRGGGHSSHGGFVQRAWTLDELVGEPSISFLETIAAHESVLALAEPGDRVNFHIDNRTAGGTSSLGAGCVQEHLSPDSPMDTN